ncbi:hypothetical protein ACFV1N_44520 [Streptosporangium canum]|uniref:hypothetical protein n=1 Tax=Streptosporangium canum TaxID=324952 RepID=UPI0036850E52
MRGIDCRAETTTSAPASRTAGCARNPESTITPVAVTSAIPPSTATNTTTSPPILAIANDILIMRRALR